MSTIVVGCGYIGRVVAARLIEQGESVFATTRTSARAEELRVLGVEPVLADVLDPASLAKLPSVERVVYSVGYDRRSGHSMNAVSVEGVRNFLGSIPYRPRMVFTSSTSVYGQTDGEWVDETSETSPTDESGRVCLEAERVAFRDAAERGIGLSIVRFSGLYGPGRIIRRAALLAGESIGGDPDKFLNLIHRDDAAVAVLRVLEKGVSGQVYLASDDRPVVRAEYYERAAAALGAPAPRFDLSRGARNPAATDANKRIRNRRLREELGLALRYPDISTGLPATVLAEQSAQPSAGSM